MSERQGSPERLQRCETGLFTYSHPSFSQAALRERRALGFGEEPLFAVREYPMIHDTEGRRELLTKLNGLLEEDEAAALDIEHARIVARGDLPELTADMEPGQIRRITSDEYREAFSNKYGDAVQGPIIF